MDIIERIHPIGEYRKSIYSFKDEFFRFWFRFVFPNYWLIEMERYDVILDSIRRNINDYLSYTWERILRELVSLYAGKEIYGLQLPIIKDIGIYWKDDLEVDVLGVSDDVIIVGEAKWTDSKIGLREIGKVVSKAEVLVERMKKKEYIVVISSKAGFKQKYEEKNIILLSLEDVENLLENYA